MANLPDAVCAAVAWAYTCLMAALSLSADSEFKLLAPLRRFCLFIAVLLVAQHAAASEVAFDYVGDPSDTHQGAVLFSTTDQSPAANPEYGTNATRFTLSEDARGATLGAVVFGTRPDGISLSPSELETVNWLVEVWDSNPGIGSRDFAQRGNVFTSQPIVGGDIQRAIVGGGFDSAWDIVGSGTGSATVPSYYIELDISDIVLEADVEYWLAIRTKLDIVNWGKTGVTNYQHDISVPSDIWTSHVVGTVLFPPYDGVVGDEWVYLETFFPRQKWAYKLTVDPFLPGDHNHDGTVDAADYALWRSDPGSYGEAQGYTDWVNNFGQTLGSGSASSIDAAVPEPSALLLVAASVLSQLLVSRFAHTFRRRA